MDWSNEVTLEFLRLYEQEPVIWNPKHKLHKYCVARDEAWERIQNSFGRECSVTDLKKKKDSLMSGFKTVQNKIRDNKNNVSKRKKVYKPTWFAYKTMARFLQGIYQPRGPKKREDFEDSTISYDTPNDEEIDIVKTELTETLSDSESFSNVTENVDTENPKRKKNENEECITYANLVVAKLRTFDRNTCDMLMHEIDCLIFKTKMKQKNIDYQPLLINE